jgi:hypothetical protein
LANGGPGVGVGDPIGDGDADGVDVAAGSGEAGGVGDGSAACAALTANKPVATNSPTATNVRRITPSFLLSNLKALNAARRPAGERSKNSQISALYTSARSRESHTIATTQSSHT